MDEPLNDLMRTKGVRIRAVKTLLFCSVAQESAGDAGESGL